MPRNGTTGIATQPVNTRAVTGETIMAEKWNSVTDDVYSILSTATPLTQGGTGASTAAGARTALDVYSTTEVDTTVSGINTSISAKADKTTTITAGDGLTGGGTLASSCTVSADIADSAAISAGTANKLVDAEGLKAVTDSLKSSYTSSPISITSGGSFTLTHGLGGKPRTVSTFAKCISDDLGYSVGDEVEIPNGGSQVSGTAFGVQLIVSSTTIFGKFSAAAGPIHALNKSTGGGPTSLTAGKWEFYVRASL